MKKLSFTVYEQIYDTFLQPLCCLLKKSKYLKNVRLYQKMREKLEDQLTLINLLQRQQKQSALIKAIAKYIELKENEWSSTIIDEFSGTKEGGQIENKRQF